MDTGRRVQARSDGSGRPSSASQLLDATAALLGERSTLDVSLSQIAGRAGLNAALIKYYFGNKEGLLLALLERDAARAMRALDHLVGMPVDAAEKLRMHISGIVNAYFRSPYLNRLIHYMIEKAGETVGRRVTQIFVEPMLAAYRTIIEQGVEEGIFRAVDPALFYYSLVGSCEHLFRAGYSIPWTLGEAGITEALKQRYITHVTDLCLQGMTAPGR